MLIKKAELVAVTAKREQYPPEDMYEIAFVGRSNVGKSSLLNLLTNRKALARVSGNPGKTRTINFYEVNGEFRIADLPGYGYAKVSKSISATWGTMIDTYLKDRHKLVKVVQLVDIRHAPSTLDVQMYEYLKHYELDGLVVATKADKVSKNETTKSIALIRKTLGMHPEDLVIPVSALNKTGHENLLAAMENVLNAQDEGV